MVRASPVLHRALVEGSLEAQIVRVVAVVALEADALHNARVQDCRRGQIARGAQIRRPVGRHPLAVLQLQPLEDWQDFWAH